MSRSGYCDDLDDWDMIRWRGQVASATRGKRGQAFLVDLLAALDAMPEKYLIAEELQAANGEVCALGALGLKRGIDMTQIDPGEYDVVSAIFGIAEQLAREVAYMNDEYYDNETPEERFVKMRQWVLGQIRNAPDTES